MVPARACVWRVWGASWGRPGGWGWPGWAGEGLDGQGPREGYLANINAGRFTTDPDVVVQAGDHVLLLAADAGG